MKMIYIKPLVWGIELVEKESFLANSTGKEIGILPPKDIMSKESGDVEEETGIPTSFTSLWGDEEEKED